MGNLRLAIPSTGALEKGAAQLLSDSDAAVSRVNSRRYTAEIPSIPGIEVIYQRQSDITTIVDSGNSDLGIVGLDRYLESRLEDGDSLVVAPDLEYGQSRLVIAVPDSWLDITSMYDLSDLSLEFHDKGRDLRIATKYPRLVKRFLNRNGINYFSMVAINGALEAGPRIGYADIIADISDTGNTLRENNLRPLVDGIAIESKAIMIGNASLLGDSEEKLNLTRRLLERIEAGLRSRSYRRVTANVKGESEGDIAEMILASPELSGMAGPTVSRVYTSDGNRWFAVQIVTRNSDVLRVVDHLRRLGGTGTAISDLQFLYQSECGLHKRLLANLAQFARATDSC
jgi:ATP phosphoribosyltransferase